MINQSAFDEHIKKQFSEYQPEVPSYLWDKIKAEKDRKKPVAFWMTVLNKRNGLIAGLILLLGSGFIYFMNSGKQEPLLSENKMVTTTVPVSENNTGINSVPGVRVETTVTEQNIPAEKLSIATGSNSSYTSGMKKKGNYIFSRIRKSQYRYFYSRGIQQIRE